MHIVKDAVLPGKPVSGTFYLWRKIKNLPAYSHAITSLIPLMIL